MRHQKRGRKLSRIRNQRRALLKTLFGSLIMKEKIQLTEAKAKELKSRIDRVINKAKGGAESSSKVLVARELSKILPKEAAQKLSGDFLKKFSKRNSGYARVIKLAPRKSDGARLSIIEFVD